MHIQKNAVIDTSDFNHNISMVIISLMPEMFNAMTDFGVLSKCFNNKNNINININIIFINPRDFAEDAHKTVDDRPFGGGPGMVLMPEPLAKSIEKAKSLLPKAPVVYLSPQGEIFDQQVAKNWVDILSDSGMIFLCGRYEGVDERVIENLIDVEISLGNFVLTGGELPLMCLLDAAIRLIPGALGDVCSSSQDSFSLKDPKTGESLLDCPHYTRPANWRGLEVPSVLLSGHHEKIEAWRLEKAREATQKKLKNK